MKAVPTLHPELAGAVREVLERAAQPLNATKLRGQLNPPFKVTAKLKDAFTQLLESEATQGRIHAWPASTAKSGPRYWIRDGRMWATAAMVEATDREPLPASKVTGSISKQYGRKPAEALIEELLESGQLIRVPLFGGSKAKLSSRVADELTFRAELDAARKIIEAGYRRLGLAAPAAPLNSTKTIATSILDTLALLEPRKGLLVTAPRLYRSLIPALQKSEIDAALLQLQQQRRVILHRHSNAQSLPEDERQSLIDGGAGDYYVGACWRVE